MLAVAEQGAVYLGLLTVPPATLISALIRIKKYYDCLRLHSWNYRLRSFLALLYSEVAFPDVVLVRCRTQIHITRRTVLDGSRSIGVSTFISA